MAKAELVFEILAKDKASKTLSKVGDTSEETGKRGQRMGKALGAGLAVVGAAAVGFLGAGVQSLKRMEQIGAQTDAVLASTGGAAGVTRSHIEGLADQIEKFSGIEAEAIQEGQNLLLTFTNIQGANFDRATQAMTDMSVAMGTDASTSAMQLGKALNDPVKGLSTLGRAGVQFTDAQKEQVKAMVAAGDTAGAQSVILKELETQFGGSAKAAGQTLGGQLAIAQAKFGDLQEELAAKLIPAISRMAEWLLKTIDFVQRNSSVIVPLVAVLGTLAAVVWTVTTVTRVWTAAQAAFNVVMALNPIGLVIIAIVALVAAFVLAWKHSETFRNIVTGAWDAIRAASLAVFGWLKSFIGGVFGALRSIFMNFTGPGLIIQHWNTIRSATVAVWNAIRGFVVGAWNGIKAAVTAPLRFAGMFDGIKGAFRSAVNYVIRAWNSLEFRIPGFDPPGPGPKFGGFVLGTPNIPQLARGGVVKASSGGTLALIGEGGHDEAVVPLSGPHAPRGGGVTVIVHGDVISEDQLLTKIRVGLQNQQRRGVNLGLT